MFNFGGFGEEDDGPRGGVDNQKFYDLLGLPKDASLDQIKKAFKVAARTHHPDKGGDAEKFKEINRAYEVLSDADKKNLYDKYGEEGLERGGPSAGGADIFDLFGMGNRRANAGGKKRGEDVVFPLKVTLEDLYNGGTKKLRLTKNIICPDCTGKGGKADAVQPCKACKGQGVRLIVRQIGPGMIQQMQTTCNDCKGQGSVINEKDRCVKCEGNKTIKEKKTLDVQIQRGMKHAQRIVFHGEADEAPNTIPGDVVVVLQRKEHPYFNREGANLFMKKSITLNEALTGFEFAIKHLDERVLLVKSEPGIVYKPGDFKCIKDEGMPNLKNPRSKGSLYIEFAVEFPKSNELPENTIKLLKKILPPPTDNRDAELLSSGDHEEAHLLDVDMQAERQRFQEQEKEAHDEDDDHGHNHGHGAQAGCRPQ